MINAEKFKKEIEDLNYIIAVINSRPAKCNELNCHKCEFNTMIDCEKNRMRWAMSEYVEPRANWSKVKIDTKVWISYNNKDWYKRYFAEFKNNKIYTFIDGKTSWSNNVTYLEWAPYAKLAEE